MLTYSRVCSLCLTTRKELLPLSTSDAGFACDLDETHLSHLTSLANRLDTYPLRQSPCEDDVTLVDRTTAKQAGMMLYGTKERVTEAALAY